MPREQDQGMPDFILCDIKLLGWIFLRLTSSDTSSVTEGLRIARTVCAKAKIASTSMEMTNESMHRFSYCVVLGVSRLGVSVCMAGTTCEMVFLGWFDTGNVHVQG